MNVIGLLLTLVVIGLIFWAVRTLMAAFGIGDPIASVVYVILVVFVVLWLVQTLGYISLGNFNVGRVR
jgi:hypothetical protein